MQLHHFLISYVPTIRPKQKYYAEIFNPNMRKKLSQRCYCRELSPYLELMFWWKISNTFAEFFFNVFTMEI